MAGKKRSTKALAHDTWAVGVHGITGQDTEEGTLGAGTLVRAIESERTAYGDLETRFEASTDGGKTWFKQRTFGLFEVRS